ncbi:MAG: hypothetical protein WD534_01795 [Phycisphaeraceae bacterium]
MIVHPNDHDSQTPPAGWRTVTLQGGPHNRVRINLHEHEDHIVLSDGPDEHRYYRLNSRDVLVHESIIGSAFGGGTR